MWVAGGFNGEDLNLVEILNLETETWRTGPSMVKPRYGLTMELTHNTLMVFGDDDIYPATREKLDGGEWREEPMEYSHALHASVTLPCP